MIRYLAALTLVLLLAACGGRSSSPTTQTPTTTAPQPSTHVALPVSLARFGSYRDVPLHAANTPVYPGPATPHSLADVRVVAEVRKELDAQPGAAAQLARNGFVVLARPAYDRFQYAYEGNVYSGWPVFVTTDAALHTWHLVFDKTLRDLEQEVLLPKLERLVSGLLDEARTQRAALAGTPLAADASKVEQLFEVAAAELGRHPALGPLAAKEKALVDSHSAPAATSPLLGVEGDYSLFTPRGHYTRTPQLRRYFVAMSVLGQLPFCLPGTYRCPGVDPLRIGLLASRALTQQPQLVALWRDVYEPTAFLVGRADDYTPLEAAAAASAALPGVAADPRALAGDGNVTKVAAALAASRPVRINPERAAVRFLGTRFVLDSYLLDQLVYPNVGTSAKPRLLPSALDVASVFGSAFAAKTLRTEGKTAYLHYDSQLAKLRAAVAARPAAAWGDTVYDAWLHALEPLYLPHGSAYPDFMRSDAWAAKDENSALGSYTELKHDTVLYAKQFMAEGGGNIPPTPRNWVEPNPVVFGRLAASATLLRDGLRERRLLTPASASLLRTEIDLLSFLERVAEDELAGRAPAQAANDRLRDIGAELEAIWLRSSNLVDGVPTGDQSDAVVADLGSGPKGVLEVATGSVEPIDVVVPDGSGGFEVAVGGVYSTYEFVEPPGRRLDDTEWRALLQSGKAPARPSWQAPMR